VLGNLLIINNNKPDANVTIGKEKAEVLAVTDTFTMS